MDPTSPPIRIYHPIAPGLLDEDVVKVLRRLRRYHHEAYLVGGCVRDLLLGVTPKDFDVATAAHPRDIRHIFRNSKVVGRRFRLAHIFFRDGKVIEVATFRRSPGEERVQTDGGIGDEILDLDGEGDGDGDGHGIGGGRSAAQSSDDDGGPAGHEVNGNEDGEPGIGGRCRAGAPTGPRDAGDDDLLITDDNIFGTPEEDARRRDFTINGLFYDLHTREIVDHVNGLPDIEARVVRSIGDPEIRIQEDPVRILRAIKFASRLGLNIDPPLWEAMVRHRWEIQRSAGPRVLEEIFRLLRCNRVLAAMGLLQTSGQLEILLPEVHDYLAAVGEGRPPSVEFLKNPGRLLDSGEPAGAYWKLLALLDLQIDERGLPPDFVLLAAVLYLPLLHQLARQDEGTNLGLAVDTLVGTLATRLRLPKREAERLRHVFVTERRLAQRRHRAGRKEALLRRVCLEEALLLHELGRRLEGEPLDRIHHLRELLARSGPRGGQRAQGDTDQPEAPPGRPADDGATDERPAVEAPPRRRHRPPQRRRPAQPRS